MFDRLLFRPLPWEYAVRNLFRRPLRTGLTLAALTAVVVLILVVAGFVQGLGASLAVSGDPRVVLLSALDAGANMEYSAIPARTPELVSASVPGIQQRHGAQHVSPELYLGTRIAVEDGEPQLGVVRGVTASAVQVRSLVQIDQGDWPEPGEVLVGRLVATKLGVAEGRLRIGQRLHYEGKTWRIGGTFSAGGSVFESEVWCRLDELQQATRRQDLSLVAVRLAPDGDFADLDLFCNQRLDLELQAMKETEYYASLQQDYRPIRQLAWLLVVLLSAAGVFCGMNTMYGAVLGRTAELAMLQTVGFARRAIALSLIQEGLLLAAAASQLAAILALIAFDGLGVRFTMGAFPLRIDGVALLSGCTVGLILGLVGAVPPAMRALRMPVVEALKAV